MPAPRNRTLTLTAADVADYRPRLLRLDAPVPLAHVLDRTLCQDCADAVPFLPVRCVDLLILDPPYNLEKTFGDRAFKKQPSDDYKRQLEAWITALVPLLKPSATVYVCSEWSASAAVMSVLERHFHVRNRITWEREKGRGAKTNWKNASEDIWFCTVSGRYTFSADAVKLKRKVLAPYTDANGAPKDWQPSESGNFRLTYPSNLWTDVSVPFWSMPENTEHPAQKPEKLLAKLILASSRAGDLVLDPFLGSGTTAVVARKLGRHFIGIERDETFCLLAEKRLQRALSGGTIQGYADGFFWERNARAARKPLRS